MKLNSHQEEIVEDIATVMYDAYIQSKGGGRTQVDNIFQYGMFLKRSMQNQSIKLGLTLQERLINTY